MKPIYKRVLLKISGEALAGENKTGINEDTVAKVAMQIKKLRDLGVQVAVVCGGGNFWRGRTTQNMERTTADYIGMLATIMNSLALQDAIETAGVPARVMTAIEMREVAEGYSQRKAVSYLEEDKVVIFGGGIGSPFFSTDTAAAMRAAEIDADVILLAKNVDAVYSDDPATNKDAIKYDKLSHIEIVEKNLKVMDLTAATLCKDNAIKIHVFGLSEEGSLLKAVSGEKIGTIIS